MNKIGLGEGSPIAHPKNLLNQAEDENFFFHDYENPSNA